MAYRGAIFDLDGVLVDTAGYHYLAWERLSRELGFEFTPEHNERLKGVSRMRSLDILLEIGGLTLDPSEKTALAKKKNDWYIEYLSAMDDSALLPGAVACLEALRVGGIRTALGSASKNAPVVLERLGLTRLLDAVIDGNQVSAAKPNPEVFLKAAAALNLSPGQCVVFEDAQAGIDAARAAGCGVVAVGRRSELTGADNYIDCVGQANLAAIFGIGGNGT